MITESNGGLNILLVGNFRPDAQQSMLRFEEMLAQGLSARGHRIIRAFPTPWLSKLARPYRYSGWPKLAGYFDKFILFPRHLRRVIKREKPDIVHIIDHANAVYASAATNAAVLVTCHDLLQIQLAAGLIPGPRPGPAGRCYQRWIASHLQRAPFVVCVSAKTQADLIALTGRPAGQSTVIHNGLNHPFVRQETTAARRTLEPLCRRRDIPTSALASFVFNLSGGQWYKNRQGLLQIYSHLREQLATPPALLLVGKDLHSSDQTRLPPCTYTTGPVSADELEALYSLADALIFPSLAEGFGWPIAEAQACGCPVFTSNRAPMTEVGGDAAVYFDPTQPESAATTIAKAWSMRSTLGRMGLNCSTRWEPGSMIAEYRQLYCKLVSTMQPAKGSH